MKELLETLKDPAALAQFIGMAAAMVALKKAACKAGVTPAANLAFSVYQGAQAGLTAFQVKTLLDSVTFKSELGPNHWGPAPDMLHNHWGPAPDILQLNSAMKR